MDAEQALLQEHEPLINRFARRYGRFWAPIEDLEQEGRLGLLQALRSYDPDGGAAISTWIYLHVRRSMTHYVRAQRRWEDARELPDLEMGDSDTERSRDGVLRAVETPLPQTLIAPDILPVILDRIWVRWMLEGVTDRQREALTRVYLEQQTFSEAGEAMGVQAMASLIGRATCAARRRA